jgi:probable HAF family extracellular repeat protein
MRMENRYAIRLKRGQGMRRRTSRVCLVLKSLGLACAICFASTAPAQNRYQIIRLPAPQGANSVALGINNKGEVVGYSFQGEDFQAFLYSSSDQSFTDAGSFGGKINAACAINDSGQATGYSQAENGNLLAFIYSREQSIAPLGTLEGGSTSQAFGINNSGAVVGDSQSGNQNHRPVLFSNGSVQDLGLGGSDQPDALETAYAINDGGQIVGRHAAGNNAFHAFEFANGNTIDFRTLGGANGEALAINKNGLVVGDSDTAAGPVHAFVIDHLELKDLGTLAGFDNGSYARGINNEGDIVGESDSADQKRAFLFTKGQLLELDQLAENLSETGFNSLDVAYGINDQGWIVGYGTTSDNLTTAFVAVPERGGNSGQVSLPHPWSQDLDQGQPVSELNEDDYDVFYTRLSPEEGDWVEAGDYGYCFRPRVSSDWQPYRDGHWVWTDRGWYWDSNESFGWATYHYGRWVDIEGTGWCWVPGNQWAPAWVSWRESDEHVGWAPLPPEADVSPHQSISSWSDSYYGIGPAAYTFISYSHWQEPSYARYIERPERNVQFINESRNVTNIVTNNNVINNFGPRVQTVATRTNQNIQQVKLAVHRVNDPKANYGQTRRGNQLNVVAPPPVLKPAVKQAPPVQVRLANPVVHKGWEGVKPENAAELKQTIAQQNPPPNNLPRPTPLPRPQVLQKGGSPRPIGPPNLIGLKPAGPPGTSPVGKPTARPGAPPAVKGAPTPTRPGGKQAPLVTSEQPPAAQKPPAPGTVPPGWPQSQPPNLVRPKPAAASTSKPTPPVNARPQPAATPRPPAVAAPQPQPQAKPPAPKPQPQAAPKSAPAKPKPTPTPQK